MNARDPDLGKRARPLCEALAEKYFADRYPGFDREDENWPELLRTAADIRAMLEIVEGRVGG